MLELKADEDIHLPLQGLDYWARVQWHHLRGEFTANGYFAGKDLSPQPPLLLLIAPALVLSVNGLGAIGRSAGSMVFLLPL